MRRFCSGKCVCVCFLLLCHTSVLFYSLSDVVDRNIWLVFLSLSHHFFFSILYLSADEFATLRTDSPDAAALLLAGGLDTARTDASVGTATSSMFSRAQSLLMATNREVCLAVLLKKLPVEARAYLDKRVCAVYDARRRRERFGAKEENSKTAEEKLVSNETAASLEGGMSLEESSVLSVSVTTAPPELATSIAESLSLVPPGIAVEPPLPDHCAQLLMKQKMGFASLASEVMSGVFMELMQDLLLDESTA